jgi:hypothetical protein
MDAWSPLARQKATGVPTTTLISTNGTDMTTHSEQERGNHALTQHDPGHSTTTTSIPLQRWDNGNYTTYPHLYANSSAHTAHPRRHRSTQDDAWPQHVAPADGEVKKLTPITSLCYRGSYSRRIRRKTAAPEATFFLFFFFIFSPFHLFTINVTRALPLETIKGRQRPHLGTTDTHLANTTHTSPKRPGICYLSRKLVTPTTSTPM